MALPASYNFFDTTKGDIKLDAAAVAAILAASPQFLPQSVAPNVTAAGTTAANAFQLTKGINIVNTVAAGAGVILPPSATVGIGGSVDVYNNDSADNVKVYGDGTIDGVAGTTGVPLTFTKRCRYTVTAAGVWVSAQLGVVSA